MVTVTVDNSPVSVQLAVGESVTVPTGETWSLSMSVTDYTAGAVTHLRVNGQTVANAQDSTNSIEHTLIAGDTISVGGYDASPNGATITGWSL